MLLSILGLFTYLYHFFAVNSVTIITYSFTALSALWALFVGIPWATVIDLINKFGSIFKNYPELYGKSKKAILNRFTKTTSTTPTPSISTTSTTPILNQTTIQPNNVSNVSNVHIMSNNLVSKTISKKVTKRTISNPDGSLYTEETIEEIINENYNH